MLEQMLLEHPGLPPALRMMGYVEYQVGRLENARRYYARLAASGRYIDEAYYYMALIALDEGDTDTAMEIFKLVAEGDFFLAAQFGVRDAYVEDGRPGEAMDYLDDIASAYPAHRVPLLMGQAAQARPVVLARGANLPPSDGGSGQLIRDRAMDMFR